MVVLTLPGWLLVTVVNFVGASVTECSVPPAAVVKTPQCRRDVAFGALLRGITGAVDAFVLQRGKERFGLMR